MSHVGYSVTWTTTIASNGNYVGQEIISNRGAFKVPARSWTNILEGTFDVKDGMLIDTLKKSSITNEPVPLVSTNFQLIEMNDHKLVWKTSGGNDSVWQRIEK